MTKRVKINMHEVRLSPEKALQLRAKYPNKYPVVVETEGDLKLLKRKFLVDESTSMGELFVAIRRQSGNLNPSEALYVFVNKGLVPTSSLVIEHWKNHNIDNCLYVEAGRENTFGC